MGSWARVGLGGSQSRAQRADAAICPYAHGLQQVEVVRGVDAEPPGGFRVVGSRKRVACKGRLGRRCGRA